jgi:hypothetical protein
MRHPDDPRPERLLRVEPVLVLLGLLLWLVGTASHEAARGPTPSPPAPGAAKHDTGPLWRDGERVTIARTGEPITWRRDP